MSVRPTKIQDEALVAAAREAANMRQLLQRLGVAAYGGNYEVVRERLAALGIDDQRFHPRPRHPPWPPEALSRAIAAADSWTDAARRLGAEGPGAERRVKRQAVAAGLDTRHMRGQAWGRGARLGGRAPESLTTLLVPGRRIGTTGLRLRLIREGVLLPECSACERATWQGAPIPLELDHRNGDRTDNRLENLRLLCPNCHAQTPTYRGRNIGNSGRPARPAAASCSGAEHSLRRLAAVLGPRS